MRRNIKCKSINLCMIIFTFCLLVRFVEYFLIKTDQTAIGENVLHKVVGIIFLALALKKINLTWRDIGFQRNGFVSGILKGLLLGGVCFAVSYGLELAIFILQGNPAHLEIYISSFSLTGSQKKILISFSFCYAYCSTLLMYGWRKVFFAVCLLKCFLKQSHLCKRILLQHFYLVFGTL